MLEVEVVLWRVWHFVSTYCAQFALIFFPSIICDCSQQMCSRLENWAILEEASSLRSLRGLQVAACNWARQSSWSKRSRWQTAGPPDQPVHYSVREWACSSKTRRNVKAVFTALLLLLFTSTQTHRLYCTHIIVWSGKVGVNTSWWLKRSERRKNDYWITIKTGIYSRWISGFKSLTSKLHVYTPKSHILYVKWDFTICLDPPFI